MLRVDSRSRRRGSTLCREDNKQSSSFFLFSGSCPVYSIGNASVRNTSSRSSPCAADRASLATREFPAGVMSAGLRLRWSENLNVPSTAEECSPSAFGSGEVPTHSSRGFPASPASPRRSAAPAVVLCQGERTIAIPFSSECVRMTSCTSMLATLSRKQSAVHAPFRASRV